jgi:endonuclease/exonuclease/phosphatase family metal-dependent hydrolase
VAAAHVEDPDSSEKYTLISMYAPWEHPHASTGSDWIYADASAHRLISDISVFVGQERDHRILASGDLNILYGYGEYGNPYWAARYRSIFDRFAAVGLNFVGPQFPNGRQAQPWPDELPRDSLNVPTYHTNEQTPATAARQLDFVFASGDIANRVQTRALNLPEGWGGSDHCRICIEVT